MAYFAGKKHEQKAVQTDETRQSPGIVYKIESPAPENDATLRHPRRQVSPPGPLSEEEKRELEAWKKRNEHPAEQQKTEMIARAARHEALLCDYEAGMAKRKQEYKESKEQRDREHREREEKKKAMEEARAREMAENDEDIDIFIKREAEDDE